MQGGQDFSFSSLNMQICVFFSTSSWLLKVPIIVKLPDFKVFDLLILFFLFSDLLEKSLN